MADSLLGSLSTRSFSIIELLLDGRVKVWIGQVNVRNKFSQQRLGALKTAFQGLDILWCGIPPPV